MWRCNWGGMFGTGGWPLGGNLFGLLLTILFMAGLISVISLIVEKFSQKRSSHSDRLDSLNIIKERFARGEISSEEYKRMKDILDH